MIGLQMANLKFTVFSMCFLASFAAVAGIVYRESESMKLSDKHMDALTIGRSYRIRNKRSNLYLSEVSITQKRPNHIEQWPLVTDENRASQVWFLIPLENDRFIITNKRTGLSLVTSLENAAPIDQANLTLLPNVSETWILQRDPTVTVEGVYYTIKNELTSLYFVVAGYSTTTAGRVHQWPLQVDANRDSQQWAFEVEEEFPAVAVANRKVNGTVEDIGDVTRITSFQQPMPSKTDEVLIGQLAIPFQLITEATFSLSQQSMQSPYYFLRRYGYWKAVTYHEHGGTSQITMTTSIKIGLITNNDKELERVTGLSVNPDTSLVVKTPKSKLIKSKIANGLKVNVDEESTEASNKTMQLERKYVTLHRQIDVVWFREDLFVLERMNGDRVLEWITRIPTTISDGFRGHQLGFPYDSKTNTNYTKLSETPGLHTANN